MLLLDICCGCFLSLVEYCSNCILYCCPCCCCPFLAAPVATAAVYAAIVMQLPGNCCMLLEICIICCSLVAAPVAAAPFVAVGGVVAEAIQSANVSLNIKQTWLSIV